MDPTTVQWGLILLLLGLFWVGVKKGWGWTGMFIVTFIFFALFFATDQGMWLLEKLQDIINSFGAADVTRGG